MESVDNKTCLIPLDTTISDIDHNSLTRDALVSCIQSLKLLVSNERTISHITSRRLASAVKQINQINSNTTNILNQQSSNDTQTKSTLENILHQIHQKDELLTDAQKNAQLLNDRLALALLSKQCEQCNEIKSKHDTMQQNLDEFQQQTCKLNEQISNEKDLRLNIQKEKDQIHSNLLQLQTMNNELLEKQKTWEKMNANREQQQTQLQKIVDQKDKQLAEFTEQLKTQQTKIDSLSEELVELPVLQKQLLEAKENQQIYNLLPDVSDIAEQPKELTDVLSTLNPDQQKWVKKKFYEIKIARVVITEKDKMLAHLRKEVLELQENQKQNELTNEQQLTKLKDMEKRLADANEELRKALLDRDTTQKSITDASTEIRNLGVKLEEAMHDLSVSKDSQAQQNEKLRQLEVEITKNENEKNELKNSVTKLHKEADKLQSDLAESNTKYAALEEEKQKLQNEIENGNTSPCSVDTFTEDDMESSSSGSHHPQSLADLEEASQLSNRSQKPNIARRTSLQGTNKAMKARIDSLAKSLQLARLAAAEKDQDLSEARRKLGELERSERNAKANLISESDERESLKTLVEEELNPKIQILQLELNEKTSELKTTEEEFELHKAVSQKTRTALENQIGQISERLENTITALAETQNRLSRSEDRGAQLDERVHVLLQEKQEHLSTIENLENECEHRRQSLGKLHEQLATVENFKAQCEQDSIDAKEEQKRLKQLLDEAHDRQSVAEKRANRKDILLHEKELHLQHLVKDHSSLVGHIKENVMKIQSNEIEIEELNFCVEEKDTALQEQAVFARQREQLFDSLSAELRGVIASRDRELRVIQDELRRSERQAKSVTESLTSCTTKLHKTETQLEKVTEQNEINLGECQRKETKLNEARDEFSHLKAEFQAAQEELALRDRQISAHLITITEKGGRIAGLRIEKAELEKAYKELQSTLDSERSKCKSFSKRIKVLETDLQNTKDELAICEEDLSMRNTEADSLGRSLTSAQDDLMRMENLVTEREEEIKESKKIIEKLELSLERSKQQLSVLESHLDGHDTLLRDCREKEEALTIKTIGLTRAEEQIQEMENSLDENQRHLANKIEEAHSLESRVNSLEASKNNLENDLKTSEQARSIAQQSLSNTIAKLAATEKTNMEEVADLNTTINSLQKVLHEKETSLNSASETISQSSLETNLAREQLIDSRARGDRLFSRLTATEYELASKKESLTVLETRFNELKQTVQDKQSKIETLESQLTGKSQELVTVKNKVGDLTSKASTIAKGEFLTMQTKLEAKEKAIANLHNWCCFINGKLHAAEKALSQRDVDVEISSAAFKKLQTQVQTFQEDLSEKESEMRKLESARVVENSELRSRIKSLQMLVEDANAEVRKTKDIMSTNGKDGQSLVALTEELQECRAQLKKKEMEMSEIQATSNSLRETLQTYERDLSASKRTMESLTLDLGQLRSETNSKRKSKSNNDKLAAVEVSKVRAETGYLLVELRKAEAELSAANENANMWQSRAQELQPLAESAIDAQRTVERISSQLSLTEKDYGQKIDLLETQLNEAKRERDAAERDCSSALADYSAIRARFTDVHSRGSLFGTLASNNELCTVTFTLDGPHAPGPDIMVYLIGADSTLGQWNISRRLPVRVAGEGRYGVVRKCDVVLPATVLTEYKYAADGPDGGLIWERGENRRLELTGTALVTLHDSWRTA